jgi:hypothetical protein
MNDFNTGKLRLLVSLLIIPLAALVMGMGGSLGAGQSQPESSFSASVKDTSSNKVQISSVTFDGKTTFNVMLGKGRVQVPLDNISRIEMKEGEACVTFTDAHTLCGLKTGGSTKIYGQTGYGLYQIQLKDVESIEIKKAAR